MAAVEHLHIKVEGRQTHGAQPWAGIDPIIVAAQIMTGLQMIPSRQLDITKAPAVVSIGTIQGGVRWNIIPDAVEMTGTIRTFDPAMREDVLERIRRTAEQIAHSAGAKAIVTIESSTPVTYNDPELTRKMIPSLDWAAGENNAQEWRRITGGEDFAYFQEKIPGLYFFLGVNKEGVGLGEAAPNHSPHFHVNEDALIVGVRALTGLAIDYANAH